MSIINNRSLVCFFYQKVRLQPPLENHLFRAAQAYGLLLRLWDSCQTVNKKKLEKELEERIKDYEFQWADKRIMAKKHLQDYKLFSSFWQVLNLGYGFPELHQPSSLWSTTTSALYGWFFGHRVLLSFPTVNLKWPTGTNRPPRNQGVTTRKDPRTRIPGHRVKSLVILVSYFLFLRFSWNFIPLF